MPDTYDLETREGVRRDDRYSGSSTASYAHVALSCAAGLVAFFWAARAIRDSGPGTPLTFWPIIGAVVALAFVVWVTAKMEDDGQRAAADDAHLLTAFLNRSLV